MTYHIKHSKLIISFFFILSSFLVHGIAYAITVPCNSQVTCSPTYGPGYVGPVTIAPSCIPNTTYTYTWVLTVNSVTLNSPAPVVCIAPPTVNIWFSLLDNVKNIFHQIISTT